MAIKFGMTIADMIRQLTKGFRSVAGRDPDGLEKIKIQQEAVQRFKEMNKVVDMQGNPIDVSKGIMGGKQIQQSPEFGEKVRRIYDKAKGPGKGQEMVDALKSPGAKKSYKIMEDQLGVKLYGDESFDEILEIQRTGKHPRGEPPGASLDDEIKQAYDKAVKEDKFKNIRLKDGRKIESEEDFREYIDELNEDNNFADGGRIGLKAGMTRRAFMKLMGAAGAGIGALKTGLLGLSKQAPEAIQTATQTVKEAPNYFFALVDKIRTLGKQSKIGPRERVNEYSYTGKNGDEYTMMEDITSGDIQITKDKMGGFMAGDEMVEGIKDRSVMEYKSGQLGEEGVSARMPDEYDEYKIEFDPEGGMADADNMSESIRKEIIEEAAKESPPIKKAGGGIATMLGE